MSPDWLAGHLGEPGVVVADSRWAPGGTGRAEYLEGHIPGAVYVDVDEDLAAPPAGAGGRHPLPAPVAFAATMSRAGIGEGDSVVVYDAVRGSHAARLWWMLAVTGHDAAVLDGGLEAWAGPRESVAAQRPPANFVGKPWPEDAVAAADDVAMALRDGSAVVLDARAPERYRGDVEPIDVKAGHIPGAISAPWAENLDPATGRFLPAETLAARYRSIGADHGAHTIAHCGSGVTGALDVLAMEVAGLGRPRLYVGSWSDWISDPRRPVTTGNDPSPAHG